MSIDREPSPGTLSRRRFLRDGALAGLAAGGAIALGDLGRATSAAQIASGAQQSRRSVAVLGGGVAGLTAAHELAERGFSVTVVEPRALGGKARSIPVPGTGTAGRRDLPGEHGFRFFPGYYRHVPDTMRRIPFGSNPNGVFDNLISVFGDFAFARGHGSLYLPPTGGSWTAEQLQQMLLACFFVGSTVPVNQQEYFVRKVLVYMTSSDARRFGEWEFVPWYKFVNATRFSREYRRIYGHGVTIFVAARGEEASTRTIGLQLEALVITLARNATGQGPPYDRILNAPTNEAWIDPWVAHLRNLGVRFLMGRRATSLELSNGRVVAARVRPPGGPDERMEADWFVCATPVEQARRLWTGDVLAADPRLRRAGRLKTEWMNGIQFYLNRPPRHQVQGHIVYFESPWALTSINQAQFWKHRDLPREYGDGSVREILSVDISDWSTPGIIYGKPASQCSSRQIVHEVWEQIKAHLNTAGDTELSDDMLVTWFLDPGISFPNGPAGGADSADPLLVNTVGSWYDRPAAATLIPNLFLASDYVQGNTDLATMEGASEAARRAVNALLERAGSGATPARLFELYRTPETQELKDADAVLYARGQPNMFDVVPSSVPL